jgi:hypothetical protein
VFSLFIAILSGQKAMPTSWQVHYEPDAVVRQFIPLLGFLSVAWASKAYFVRRLAAGDPFYAAPFFLFLCLVVAPAVMYQQDRQYQGHGAGETVLALYGALNNNITIALLFLNRLIFLEHGVRRYAALVFILFIVITTHFIQFWILTATMLVLFVSRQERIVAASVFATVVGAYAIGLNHIPEIIRTAPNSGIRLAFASDAITSVIDTSGLGIGFGTESVRWNYAFPDMPIFTFLPDARFMTHERLLSALSTGVENSFMQSMLRTGLIGFALLASAFIALIPSAGLPRPVRNHAMMVLITIVIGCFVNSALESPLATVGIGFCYGYLIALNGSVSARKGASARRKPLFTSLTEESAPCPRAARPHLEPQALLSPPQESPGQPDGAPPRAVIVMPTI